MKCGPASTLAKARPHLDISMLTFADTDDESEGEKGQFEELVLLERMNDRT
jgi:hypothetical protein